jgi:hypothetical protein
MANDLDLDLNRQEALVLISDQLRPLFRKDGYLANEWVIQ